MATLHLVPADALGCFLADGREKPWGYLTEGQTDKGPNAVILYSPGYVDSTDMVLVGMRDGRVKGLNDSAMNPTKAPPLKMSIYPDK